MKIGGIKEVMDAFNRQRQNNINWVSPFALSQATGISEERIKRILDRNQNKIRRSRGQKEVYTLI